MKRKFYSWEECMNLREVKVNTILQATAEEKQQQHLTLISFLRARYCHALQKLRAILLCGPAAIARGHLQSCTALRPALRPACSYTVIFL